MTRVERVRDQHGTDVTIDHRARTIRGRVALPTPGPCPHSHEVWAPVTARLQLHEGGPIIDEMTEMLPTLHRCIGQARHFGDHMDSQGRSWPAKHKDRKRRRGR